MIFPEPLHAEERSTLREKEVIVLFEEPLRIAAKEVATLYPVLKKELEKEFGPLDGQTPYERKEFYGRVIACDFELLQGKQEV